ncbi:Hsp20/alpha crystallin family protein [Halanaeroarchaeum sulfurireducens]|uniref:Hsp20 type chaperone n=1 Tax=Halanaeroarchaeum sulfurireducens TaxID=1604004 RepID=A0A0F7P9H4_9EURY|nr:Hsp20/alpha crystallin family protein [Halanaeroarchaeum sulfurireducens]AKH96855.1 hsp20 type chaperone [Halanaeroarchaeum sulfurireducens]ALG81257.1 hsp20 type chaperone [Halanaeroarchaeum sulfurireducens]
MRRDDRDDPFDDIFREIERMMDEMMQGDARGNVGFEQEPAGFGSDTHVDVQETDDDIRVVADLPGVAKSDISLQCDGDHLTVSAASDVREYDERITLPAPVDPDTGTATYNNGVLEVVFDRAARSTDIDVE